VIYDQAVALRAYYAAALTAAGRPPFERAHTSDGAVAFDGCPSLIVENVGMRTGTVTGADQFPVREATQLVADWHVWAWRCVPVVDGNGNPPSSSETEASAKVILTDRWILATTTLALFTDPASPFYGCQRLSVLGVDAVGPEGGLAGTVVRLAVTA